MSRADLPAIGIALLGAALRLWPTSRSTPNPFYDAAVRSMGLSWHNFFFGAIEPGGSVSIDKPPADLWLQVASTKVFGFTNFALHLPEAVGGASAVVMLYFIVRAVWGRLAGTLAGSALAVLPISVLTSRSDTMDSVMVAVIVGALWASVRALETRRWTWIVAAAGLMGVAFNVKLTQALIPLPALAVMWWAAAGRHRLRVLLAAGATFVVVSMSWIVIASSTPITQRPYPIGSGNGSIYRVVFLFNGLDRIRGPAPQLGSSTPTATGPLRLVTSGGHYDQLIGVELVAAIALLVGIGLLGLVGRVGIAGRSRPPQRDEPAALDGPGGPDRAGRRVGRERDRATADRRRVARWTAVGIGLWLVTAIGLLSEIRQLQTRYVETASPAVAAVLGVCAAVLIERALSGEHRQAARRVLGTTLVISGAFGMSVASDVAGGLAGACGVVVGLVLGLWPRPARAGRDVLPRRGVTARVGITMAVGLAVLALPLRVSVGVITDVLSDATQAGSGAEYGPYLRAHRAGARYEVASGDTLGVVALIAADAQPVLLLEDVKGPLVRLARLQHLVRRGDVRFVLIAHPCSAGRGCPSVIRWSLRHAVRIRGGLYGYTASARKGPATGGRATTTLLTG